MLDNNEENQKSWQQEKTYTLLGPDKKPYQSNIPGTYGGHRKTKVYGRMDCPAALRAIAKGGYIQNRVFFADEETAIAAGFRPCASCLREKYMEWKERQKLQNPNR
ncbi:Ada metal-binding domain-containing protein [Neobacillus sp. GCM10023253]|uniref:Ada metal-binding domain-containing protein n=1 Tax=Neobacillus sp. GCM10023253 TaxID=3252644 RepID=UPI00361E42B3